MIVGLWDNYFMLTQTHDIRFTQIVILLTLIVLSFALMIQPAKGEERIEFGSINKIKKVNVPAQIKEIKVNLDQASQTIANHDYYGTKPYLDRAILLFQGIQQAGKAGGSGMQASLNKIESDIFITHQQMILGQRKREMEAKSVFRKTQQKQVDSNSHYYDLWSRDMRYWEPD